MNNQKHTLHMALSCNKIHLIVSELTILYVLTRPTLPRPESEGACSVPNLNIP